MKWKNLLPPKAQVVLAGARFWRKHEIGKRLLGKELTSEQIELEAPKETKTMGKYSKAIGMVVGGLIGVIVTKFPMLDFLGNPAIVDQAVVLVTGLIGTYFAPKNSD